MDRAHVLTIEDIFTARPRQTSLFVGFRPSRQFDTVLHTAPIARGNSGGPLLDACGRVLGVNSFGAESEGADGEFFFAVSVRELVPFLRANEVAPRINDTPCRSLADLDADEQARSLKEQQAARAAIEQRRGRPQDQTGARPLRGGDAGLTERDDRLLANDVLLLLAAGLGWWAYEKRVPGEPLPRNSRLAAAGAGAALLGALFLQLTRPGIEEIDRISAAAVGGKDAATPVALDGDETARKLVCRLDPAAQPRHQFGQRTTLPFECLRGGCVNGRTQYGFSARSWNRVLVPNDEPEVSVTASTPPAANSAPSATALAIGDAACAAARRLQAAGLRRRRRGRHPGRAATRGPGRPARPAQRAAGV